MELWYEVTFPSSPNNRPRHSRKSSFLLRHCRAKVAPFTWKHASKLTNSVDVVIACGSMRKIYHTSHCVVISTRIIASRQYGESFHFRHCFYRRRTCFHRVKILTDNNERDHEQRIMAGRYFRRAVTRSRYRSSPPPFPENHDFPRPAYILRGRDGGTVANATIR